MSIFKIRKHPVCLVREYTTLYFRQVIPSDLRTYFGRASIKISMKTCNIKKAKRKAAVMSAIIWEIFNALRKGDIRVSNLTSAELRQLANTWLKEILEADELERRNGMSDVLRAFWRQGKDEAGAVIDEGYSQVVIDEIDTALLTNDFKPSHYKSNVQDNNPPEIGGVFMLEKYITEFLNKHGIDIKQTDTDYIALCREMAKVYRLFLQIGQFRTSGDYFTADKLFHEWELMSAVQSDNTPRTDKNRAYTDTNEIMIEDTATGISIKLSAFIKEYMAKAAVKLDTKTQIQKKTALNKFLDYVGDEFLHKIPVDKARRFRELYYCLPTYSDSKRYKGKTMEEMADLALDGLDLVAPRTVYKNLSDIRAALKWGQKEGYRIYAELPSIVAGAKPDETIPPEEKRDAFTSTDIQRMLAHRGYTADAFEYSFQFWLPILGLYTGARMSELCQINPQTDLAQTESGLCWYLDLMDFEDDKIKNRQSRRRIPLHDDLIELGILNFIEHQRDDSRTLIFPELMNDRADGAINAMASRWFNDKFREEVGIKSMRRKLQRTDIKKDFHSFRHTFASYAAMHGVSSEMLELCQGHKSKDTSASHIYVSFWKNKEAPDLIYKEVMKKINFNKDFELNIMRFKNGKFTKGKDKIL